MAVANYKEANGHYPPAHILGPDGRPWHSWRVLLLPYLEHQDLFKEYDFSQPWDGPRNRRLAERMPKVYAFHGGDTPGNTTSNYLTVVGPETVWPGSLTASGEAVSDSQRATIVVVENLGAGVHWMEPRDLLIAGMDFAINSPGGVSSRYSDPGVAMLDGSLYRLKKDISPETLRALLTIGGGEPVESDGAGGWEWLPDGRQRPIRQP
ncbi:MAG: DUF1559 domain-containing protein [Gemmataceae bacterium]|nr:DUF1559 domain-containing protein [Gemmataceae bacterium]